MIKKISLITAVLLATLTLISTAGKVPLGRADQKTHLQTASKFAELNKIIDSETAEKKVTLAPKCSDEIFCRRIYLDLAGTLPTPEQATSFFENSSPDKRAKLINQILESKEFAWYWSLKWGDHLRIKSEFPIKLWPNAVAAYSTWVTHAIEKNMPYDKFARALLTTSGSNFRKPAVNFYRAIQLRTPHGIAGAVSLTFLGCDLKNLTHAQQKNLTQFFTRVKYKSTSEWKEEIVFNDPAPVKKMVLTLPDGSQVTPGTFEDRREVFANWLTKKQNRFFARSAVNRIWFWIFGKGLIHPADNCSLANPPVYPKILRYLETEFIRSGYDRKHLIRLIVNSKIYNQSAVPVEPVRKAKYFFASYPVRRLDAEIIIDAINQITGSHEKYMSIVPEPFTFIPTDRRTIQLADGSITSEFLNMFGRPNRDTGKLSERNNKPSISQQLFMLNSTTLANKIKKSKKLSAIIRGRKYKVDEKIDQLYLLILSREPTSQEKNYLRAYLKKARKGRGKFDAAVDIVWALMNTKEFLYRH